MLTRVFAFQKVWGFSMPLNGSLVFRHDISETPMGSLRKKKLLASIFGLSLYGMRRRARYVRFEALEIASWNDDWTALLVTLPKGTQLIILVLASTE